MTREKPVSQSWGSNSLVFFGTSKGMSWWPFGCDEGAHPNRKSHKEMKGYHGLPVTQPSPKWRVLGPRRYTITLSMYSDFFFSIFHPSPVQEEGQHSPRCRRDSHFFAKSWPWRLKCRVSFHMLFGRQISKDQSILNMLYNIETPDPSFFGWHAYIYIYMFPQNPLHVTNK